MTTTELCQWCCEAPPTTTVEHGLLASRNVCEACLPKFVATLNGAWHRTLTFFPGL